MEKDYCLGEGCDGRVEVREEALQRHQQGHGVHQPGYQWYQGDRKD